MNPFKAYAHYYNLINADKDYEKEVAYIESLIQMYKPAIPSILELGSGTGNHAVHFAQKGYQVVGVDISKEMVEIANQAADQIPGVSDKLLFVNADIRDVAIDTNFDVVLSLFHVMSYLLTNDDLEKGFQTASKHLKNQGLFIFDCWYGPAVLAEKPEVRVKRYENEELLIHRIAEPTMYPNENRVDVHYEIMVQDKNKGLVVDLIHERHPMRYLFLTEVQMLARHYGFEVLHAYKYLTREALSFASWNGCMILRKVSA